MKNVKIGNKKIGDGCPTFTIAEMAWSHDGSVEKAKKIIKAATDAKADAICFHITSLKDYMIPQYGSGRGRVSAGKETKSIYEYLESINLKNEAWKKLFSNAKKLGLLICAMCNDIPSLNFISELKPDAYVISPAALSEEDLVKEMAKKGKPIFVRTGGAYVGEIEKTIFWIKETRNEEIVLIHGFQNYPTKVEDMNLRYLSSLKSIFSLPVGFTDHTDGDSELAMVVPLVAMAFGANVIEKHLTHDRALRGEDFESALNPDELKRLIHNIREIEKTFGSASVKLFSEDELNYRQVSKKRTVARRDLKKGEKITKEDLTFKRSDEGVFPDESKYLIGRTTSRDIKKDEPITWDKLV